MKRKVTLVVLLSTGIVLGYVSFIAWSAGFLLAKYLGSKTVGEPSKIRSYFIPLGKYRIHLHHWLLSSGVIIVFAVIAVRRIGSYKPLMLFMLPCIIFGAFIGVPLVVTVLFGFFSLVMIGFSLFYRPSSA